LKRGQIWARMKGRGRGWGYLFGQRR